MSVTTEEKKGLTTGIDSTDEKPSIVEVLKNKAFMLLFGAQFIENIGRAISGLALEFLIWDLTKSPFMMGILAIIWLLPFVLITPLAGVYTDRFDQRKIMLWSNILSALSSFGYLLVYLFRDSFMVLITTYGFRQYSSRYMMVALFILCFLNSSSAAFFFPARSAYTRLIVKKKNLLIANSIGSTVFQIATIVGFVLAGVLAAISYRISFIFDASTFVVSGMLILLIFRIGKKPPDVVREKSTSVRQEFRSIYDDMKIGFRSIREHPKISYMLLIFSGLTFAFGAINVLFVVILRGEMDLSATWYGALQGVMGATGIIAAIVLMSFGKLKRKILLINLGFLGATIGMYVFAVSRNAWVIATVFATYGVLSVMINVPASTLIQERVPYEKQGRVFGFQQLAQGIAQLVGMGIVSLIAEYVLPIYVLLASSVILSVLIISGFVYSARKGLMIDDYADSDANGKKDPLLDKIDDQKELDISTDISIAEISKPIETKQLD
ncbi:MAG: MFS transporter [Candidatus Heimdallarchaeota archaeon]|nr:MFS transporter [Candidatus Heimdallarchaeota archaeon]MBY8993005.1 MFS transporter [Candidatus Heimdallarchaeota archaeon]